MTLLALDQASAVSGYAIFQDNKLIASGTFSASGDDVGAKLVYIINKIRKFIEEYNVDEVVFEDIQLQQGRINNVRTYKVLAEVIGAIEEFLTENKIKYEIVSSATWRSQLGIKGTVREQYKKAAQAYVLNHYGKKASQDESDAICIGSYKLKYNTGFNWDS